MFNAPLVDSPSVQGIGIAPFGSVTAPIAIACPITTPVNMALRPTTAAFEPQVFLATPGLGNNLGGDTTITLVVPVVPSAPTATEYRSGDVIRILLTAANLNAKSLIIKDGGAAAAICTVPKGAGAPPTIAFVEAQLNAAGTNWVLIKAGGF